MEDKKTLVIGASTNPERYSYMAIHSLRKHGYDTVGLAKRTGQVSDILIQTNSNLIKNIHTVTLYIGKSRQMEYYDFLINLKPKRVIFNPGTENPELEELLVKNNIEAIEACTLVMLSTNQF